MCASFFNYLTTCPKHLARSIVLDVYLDGQMIVLNLCAIDSLEYIGKTMQALVSSDVQILTQTVVQEPRLHDRHHRSSGLFNCASS